MICVAMDSSGTGGVIICEGQQDVIKINSNGESAMKDLDQEVQVEWDEYIPDLIAGIEEGYLDAHLRTVARALFARRDVIRGDKPKAEAFEVVGTVTVTATVKNPFTGKDHELLTARNQVAPAALYVGPQVEIFGKAYTKSDLVGKAVSVPPGVLPAKYTGALVAIVGVGPARCKVQFINPDQVKMSGRMRVAGERGDAVFVPHTILKAVLA